MDSDCLPHLSITTSFKEAALIKGCLLDVFICFTFTIPNAAFAGGWHFVNELQCCSALWWLSNLCSLVFYFLFFNQQLSAFYWISRLIFCTFMLCFEPNTHRTREKLLFDFFINFFIVDAIVIIILFQCLFHMNYTKWGHPPIGCSSFLLPRAVGTTKVSFCNSLLFYVSTFCLLDCLQKYISLLLVMMRVAIMVMIVLLMMVVMVLMVWMMMAMMINVAIVK